MWKCSGHPDSDVNRWKKRVAEITEKFEKARKELQDSCVHEYALRNSDKTQICLKCRKEVEKK